MFAKNYGVIDTYTVTHTYTYILYFGSDAVIGCYMVFITEAIFCLPEGPWVFLGSSSVL